MDRAARTLVVQRAGQRCEYCHLPEQFVPVAFHVEHIVARQHGGGDDPDNLAFASDRCNWHKGTNLTGIDPDTGQIVPLFDPRRQVWSEHFAWKRAILVGTSPTGRATAHVLQFNAAHRLRLRTRLWSRGLLP